MFKPFQIKVKMVTPIVPGKFPLHLDSLVYWYLSNFYENDFEILEVLNTIIDKQDDTYLCSAMYFEQKPKFVKSGIASKTDLMFSNLLDLDVINEYEIAGETKLAAVHAIESQNIFFNATCDREKIENVLNRINGIGRLTNSGFGEVHSVHFTELENDKSIISDGKLMRVIKDIGLSKEQIENIGGEIGIGKFSPPYHTTNKSSIIIPKRLSFCTAMKNQKRNKANVRKGGVK